MIVKKARCFERWAMAGGGLIAVGLIAVTTAVTGNPSPVAAADIGEDTYRADAVETRRGTRLNGRGHTFDVEPRHPQTVQQPPHRDKTTDRNAYRDDDDAQTYDDTARNNDHDRSYSGSLKDDPVEEKFETRRDRYRERWQDRDYADDWQGGRDRCIPRRLIRRQLRQAGWRDLRRRRVRGNIGYVVARQRGTGEIYKLAVDQCTGDVISAACIGRANRSLGRGRFRNRGYREDVVIRW